MFPRNKAKFISVVVSIIAALSLTAGAGLAQNDGPDVSPGGSPDGSPNREVNGETLNITNCGTVKSAKILTQNASTTVTSTTPVTIASTSLTLSDAECVLVEFSSESACSGNGTNFCGIRATLNGVSMLPVGDSGAGPLLAFDSESSTAQSHSHQWVRRVAAGAYTVAIQAAVGPAGSSFFLDDWTFTIMVLQ
jgi:hypothetical protein